MCAKPLDTAAKGIKDNWQSILGFGLGGPIGYGVGKGFQDKK
tara:strand:- start:16 stop:141 length:126 start_codon:yes stop_codon:yes gene_type:complete